jgi:hypothetical protein
LAGGVWLADEAVVVGYEEEWEWWTELVVVGYEEE